MSSPFGRAGRFFMYTITVPIYRLFYSIRKQLVVAYKPQRNRFMATFSNRYVVHIVAGLIILIVGFLNLQTDRVRAEAFGERSLMYQLVGGEGLELVEEYGIGDGSAELLAVNYRGITGVSSYARGIDTIGSGDIITSLVGGSSLSAPTISEPTTSIAPRDTIETYIVQSGDTLSSIAEQFSISLNTLLWSNNLKTTSVINPGGELTILPTSGVVHTVSNGDTLSSIAIKYDVDVSEITEYNKISGSSAISIGEELIIPGGQVKYVSAPSVNTAISQIWTSPAISSAPSSSSGASAMIWPTDWRTITQYYGWTHNGLDIDCGYTQNNYAADDGIVTYSGWLGGYGYLVEINHGNGIVTRYGHHSSLYVYKGQSVSAGQAIGLCGTTGRSTGTHLHFEVIVNGSNKNPLEYIR